MSETLPPGNGRWQLGDSMLTPHVLNVAYAKLWDIFRKAATQAGPGAVRTQRGVEDPHAALEFFRYAIANFERTALRTGPIPVGQDTQHRLQAQFQAPPDVWRTQAVQRSAGISTIDDPWTCPRTEKERSDHREGLESTLAAVAALGEEPELGSSATPATGGPSGVEATQGLASLQAAAHGSKSRCDYCGKIPSRPRDLPRHLWLVHRVGDWRRKAKGAQSSRRQTTSVISSQTSKPQHAPPLPEPGTRDGAADQPQSPTEPPRALGQHGSSAQAVVPSQPQPGSYTNQPQTQPQVADGVIGSYPPQPGSTFQAPGQRGGSSQNIVPGHSSSGFNMYPPDRPSEGFIQGGGANSCPPQLDFSKFTPLKPCGEVQPTVGITRGNGTNPTRAFQAPAWGGSSVDANPNGSAASLDRGYESQYSLSFDFLGM